MVTIRTKSYARTPSGIRYGDMPWDGILSLAGSLVSTSGAVKASKYAANKQLEAVRETNDANAALAKQQNDFNLDMWNKSNEYNTTSAQMERWREAGLNPNSFTGTPYEAAPISSAELANQVAPDLSALRDVGPAIQRGMDQGLAALRFDLEKKRTMREIKHLDATDETLQAQAKNLLKDIGLKESQIDLNDKQGKVLLETISEIQTKVRLANEQANEAAASANLKDTSANEIRLRTKMFRETWDEQKLSLKLQNQLTKSSIGLNADQAKLLTQKLKTEIIDGAIKANEFNMTDFNNWLAKTLGMLEIMDKATDNEKEFIFTSIYSAVGTAIQMLYNGLDAPENSRKRDKFRLDLFNQAHSWLNPVMP